MLSLCLAWALLQEGDLRELIELLSSESIEVRQDAAGKLAKLGRPAVTALQKAAESADAQLSSAARDVLAIIARRSRVDELRPPTRRVDLVFAHETLGNAISRVAREFQMDTLVCDPPIQDRRISLELKCANLWQVFDALTLAGDAEISGLVPGRGRVGFENQLLFQDRYKKPFPYYRHLNLDDARIMLDSSSRETNNGRANSHLRVVLALPSTTWVENARLSDIQVTRELRDLEYALDSRGATCHRIRRLPTRVTVGGILVDAKEQKPFDVRGVLLLDLPEDVESLRPSQGNGEDVFAFPFGDVRGSWEKTSHKYSIFIQGRTEAEPLSFQVAARDAAGEWICDMPFRIRSGVSFQHSQSEILKVEPARLEAWRVTRTTTRAIPFRFQGVEVPDLK